MKFIFAWVPLVPGLMKVMCGMQVDAAFTGGYVKLRNSWVSEIPFIKRVLANFSNLVLKEEIIFILLVRK